MRGRVGRGPWYLGLVLAALISVLVLTDPDPRLTQQSVAALKKCQELMAQAEKVESSAPAKSRDVATEAINTAAPARDVIDAQLVVSPKEYAPFKPRRDALHACVHSADFLVARVSHATKADDEEGVLNEYLQRYPKDANEKTVREWLKQRASGKK
jgi:hypothetical protein